VVCPAVVALGKDGNAVDAPALQHFLKLALRELRADCRDRFGRMKIEMDLSKSHGKILFGKSLV
jgi:hypothetical protein